ncbi:MAG: hypothetical protein KA744_11200, partial [Phenylobacterium sp.]|nr:hypothetical protein [Phenylobacterium sp.]
MSLFLRLLGEEHKGAGLEAAIRSVAAGELDGRVFVVEPDSFEQVPGAPFAYWVSEATRRVFQALPAFEQGDRYARRGPSTCDDFRYLRLWFEAPAEREHGLGLWCDFSKGGAYSPFYSEIHLLVEWEPRRRTFFGFFGRPGRLIEKPESLDYFFRPGLTWPRRTQSGLALRAMPAGCIFADKGPAAFVEGDDPTGLLALLAVTNSATFRRLVELQMAFGSYEVGVIQRTPVPDLSQSDTDRLAALARSVWSLKRNLDTATLTSHAFVLPALLQADGADLGTRVAAQVERVQRTAQASAEIQAEIDARCFDLYGFSAADRAAALGTASGLEAALLGADEEVQCDPADADGDSEGAAGCDPQTLGAELVDWLVGVAFGRFDVRLATYESFPPDDPEPFDPLPVCPPGMLQGDDGLPLSAEHGRRLRTEGRYPLDIAWDGILVDDPEHPLDIEQRVQDVLALIWGDRTDAIQQEACELLGVPTLRDWFRRSAGFFADHLKRYSKSRRQAPIYWPLSTPGGRYSLWLCYHRFSKDSLYRALELVQEKVNYEERKLLRLTADAGGTPGAAERTALADQESLMTELRTLQAELARVAPLWNPNLNDGVILNYGPLWRMIGHTPWQKSVKEKWDALVAGQYDWAHLAMHLWPERVVPQCATDRSLAIAHGLEAVFWKEGDNGKWMALTVAQAEVDRLIAERTSAAVKDALKSLLDAPAPVTGRGGGRKSSGRAPVRRAPTVPRSDNAGPGSSPATGSVAPDPVMLDAVKQAIAAAAGGTSKSE